MAGIVVNKIPFDWANIEVSIADKAKKISGIQSINFGWDQETAFVRDTGGKITGITDGQFTPQDSKLTLTIGAYEDFIQVFGYPSVKSAGANGINFDLVVTLAKDGATVTRTLQGCRPVGESNSWSQSPDGLVTEMTIRYMDIV